MQSTNTNVTTTRPSQYSALWIDEIVYRGRPSTKQDFLLLAHAALDQAGEDDLALKVLELANSGLEMNG